MDTKKIAQNTKKREENAKRGKKFTLFFIIIVFLFFAVLAFENLFNIEKIEVEGISETAPYNAGDVITFLNVEEGTNLITFDKGKTERALLYEFPYIEKIDIKKKLPNTLRIIITENRGTLFVEIGHDFFILSSSGRVLEVTDDPYYDTQKRARLVTGGIKRCISGEDIVFEKSESLKIIQSITSALDKYEMTDKITLIDTTDKFNITLSFDDRFKIIFGTFENAESKIQLLSRMMENEIWDESSGTIDISSSTEALVKFDDGNIN